MDLFNGSYDLMRLVFLIGAVLALVCKKKIGITPGGIIVPGTLACVLFASFMAFVVTSVATLICWVLYKRVVSAYALSNRWTSLVMISLSVAVNLLILAFLQVFRLLDQETLILSMIIPGLVTISAKKYGFGRTSVATLTVTAVTMIAGWLVAVLVPFDYLSYISVHLAQFTPLTLSYPFVVLPLSLLVAILVFYRYGTRSGGYLISPFLAMIAFSSLQQALLLLAGVGLSYGVIRLMQTYTLIIGLERFVLCIFCGYFVVTVLDYLAIAGGIANYRPAPLMLIIMVAVLTNDLALQPVKRSIKHGLSPAFLLAYITRAAV